MKLNLETLIKKLDLETKEKTTDKFWIESAKKLIIDNFEENISIEQLELKISNLKVNNENEISIIALAKSILGDYEKKEGSKICYFGKSNKKIKIFNQKEIQNFQRNGIVFLFSNPERESFNRDKKRSDIYKKII
ncbi:hypothetical protein [Spiroplasma floricola]|uniref:Uncharacterized protein n=1 Tax=Spiroplasma floricola 23-6 TaxID=1336749 RepID=A0A2K8SF11_9MOLU|nr:hypothetical protein [Spiroplasma floricola]AUB32026.1 hypothetical protein SFLOR_v1c09780 [Spiroplasma floricola 23-6]